MGRVRCEPISESMAEEEKVYGTVSRNDGSCSLHRRRADVFGAGCYHACGTPSQR